MLTSFFIIGKANFRTDINVGKIVMISFLVTLALGSAAHALTSQQAKGMYRHGIWEWTLQNCSGVYRNKGYWFALKEVGKFKSQEQIRLSEGERDFSEGWEYMATNAQKFGVEKTCDYAIEHWPAVLWRK